VTRVTPVRAAARALVCAVLGHAGLVAVPTSCSGRRAELPAGAEVPAPAPLRPPVIAPVRVVSRASFDIVATGEGAVLVWAGLPAVDGAVRGRVLDPLGGVRGPEVVLEGASRGRDTMGVGALVTEVAAAAAEGRLGVA
jgi:hypothetical protein